ncbi:hypothetical protein CONPUDRAFT_164829 [Coniophora puteana RWD-64-598 SS2]|uniref:Mitochondrial distribution and morphology protein 10 n=1 Tax=Coniophora puteana (strain RWD-64-598) TaxID=741705 RepID=A0A5M3MTW9_CONPW|nr:uncharacterized protein CONPUDRAFT_164829 [Coniophora puteana RWD-64-598 SS2]EIW82194.1 hypothetical protein CONPUDRAFT_164829 [Coniophora puteana RWD-64-598 SS2]
MHPFASYVLRCYYKATGWNEDNLYANITRSSNAILDFTIPRGLHFSISKSPNSLFNTSYSMNAMPSLNGSIGYVFTSCDLNVQNSGDVHLKDMIERFRVYDQPKRPATDDYEGEWKAGEKVHKRDYLLYGRLYLPTGRLDALYSARLTPTLQALIAAISDPRNPQKSGSSNLMFSLQHDVGKWCSEWTYSAEDGMWGARVLHNFGRTSSPSSNVATEHAVMPEIAEGLTDDAAASPKPRVKRVDEEDATGGGLKGRVSIGAEFYVSAKERSAGVSTGIRFTTLPDATPPSFQLPSPASSPLSSSTDSSSLAPPGSSPLSPSSSSPPQSLSPPLTFPAQPPTTITALFNPMMGHLSAAYAARVSRDLALCSRFDFNVYSYDSEWTMGLEWWMRRSSSAARQSESQSNGGDSAAEGLLGGDIQSNNNKNTEHRLNLIGNVPAAGHPPLPLVKADEPYSDIQGVVKARISTSNNVSLMWEGRLKQVLVSLGVVSDLSSRSKPIKGIGLEVSYFSTS